jgi:hypothetical protein
LLPRSAILQAEAVLNSLRFRPLPPLPADPYAGWKLLTTESGDSLRPPPGWPASATFMPRNLPRPRPLFFASNLPLPGVPARPVPSVTELPAPFPTQALDAFPAGGAGGAHGQPLGRVPVHNASLARGPFPAGDHRAGAAMAEPQLAARGRLVSNGYRFSVWTASGPEASERDRALALKSAASLALSGCLRDNSTHCPDGR